MPEFGAKSKIQLSTAHPDLQKLFNEVVRHADCTILEGFRGEKLQNKFYDEGKSKLKFPNGNHNKYPSLAVDVSPYPIDWSNKLKSIARFYHFAGIVKGIASQMGLHIRWGGDWDSDYEFTDQTFDDLPHFELRPRENV